MPRKQLALACLGLILIIMMTGCHRSHGVVSYSSFGWHDHCGPVYLEHSNHHHGHGHHGHHGHGHRGHW